MSANTHDQFNRDLDDAIRNVPFSNLEDRSDAERGEIETLQALAAADFSGESRIRHSLKRRLIDQTVTANPPYKPGGRMQALPRLAALAALIALLAFAASPLGAAVAQSIVRIFESRQVGENTTAVSVEGDFQAVPGEDGETVIVPAAELPSLPEPALEETGERHLALDPTVPFDQAQEMVKFPLRMPAYLPEGYSFIGVVVIRTGQASLEFINVAESRLIGLLQTAVGGENGKVQITYTSDMVAVDTEVDGHAALWTQAGDEGLLTWEADGVNYQLVGVSDLETALRIAESLR